MKKHVTILIVSILLLTISMLLILEGYNNTIIQAFVIFCLIFIIASIYLIISKSVRKQN